MITVSKLILYLSLASWLLGPLCLAQHNQKQELQLSVIGSQLRELPYSVNADLTFEPHNKTYFQTIAHELDALCNRFGNKSLISLSNNLETQSLAPTLCPLLINKIQTIATRMNLDISTINVGIKPMTDDISDLFNAHAQTKVCVTVYKECKIRKSDGTILETKTDHNISSLFNLVLNEETILLLAWHEGDSAYASTEKLLDGVIAHELGHIYHQHTQSKAQYEHEADAIGSQCLVHPKNLINSVDMLYLAGNLFTCLRGNASKLGNLTREKSQAMLHIIAHTLMNNIDSLGTLGMSTSHTQFASEINHAIQKAIERIESKHAYGNDQIVISLLYDELKDKCLNPLPSEGTEVEVVCKQADQTLALYSQLTHPDPKTRRERWAQACR